MEFADALREFADLLLTGSTALNGLIGQAMADSNFEIAKYLIEIQAISGRLQQIAQAIDGSDHL